MTNTTDIRISDGYQNTWPALTTFYTKHAQTHAHSPHHARAYEILAAQHQELTRLHKEYEEQENETHLRLGKKAAQMLLASERHARVMRHRSIGTEDILHALFHTQDGQVEESEALKFLQLRGVTKESLYSNTRYSDNGARILQAAQMRAKELKKPVVGTEDILWATFHVDHTTSRSRALQRLIFSYKATTAFHI